MEPSETREVRGKSVELDGSRRINAVSPMHLGESMLQNLLKEHQQQQTTSSGSNSTAANSKPQEIPKVARGEENDRKLQQMLEKYQSQVKLQQQRNPPLQHKTSSRNNLQMMEKLASSSRPTGSSPSSHPMSHSQPCLIAITDRPPDYSVSVSQYGGGVGQHPNRFERRSSGSGEQQHEATNSNGLNHQRVPNNQKLVLSLREENVHLKRESDTLKKKLVRLQQIESAYERIERDYDVLLREKERQESIENNALIQMDMHLKRVIGEKEMLQNKMEQLQLSLPSQIQTVQAMEKVNHLNSLINELIPQNKELKLCSDRQKMEINAQSATLEEQRNHIAMLEKALGNAQDRLAKRERTCEELSIAAERANMLQRQLHDTLLDKQARDEAHATERAHWEMESTQLKMQLNKDASLTGSLKRSNGARLSIDNGDEALLRMKKTIHNRDERITQLERTVVELQRKHHEECERKKGALGALSENLESKIRRLEEEKNDKDRRISELLEEKERLANVLGDNAGGNRNELFYSREGESSDPSHSLNVMEEIRQKIQERKRKGRVGPTGGLIGVPVSDHSRSSSGSLLQSSSHLRTSSGPFDPSMFDSSLLSNLSSSYSTQNAGDSNGNGSAANYKISFRGEKREDEHGDAVWNI